MALDSSLGFVGGDVGLTERMRAHAVECEKLAAKNLWSPEGDPKVKKQKVQTVLSFGATNIKVFHSGGFWGGATNHGGFQVDELERQVGKFVFATNAPFSIVENKEFLGMMQMVRPGVKLPGRLAIGGRILNSVYDAEWQKFTETVKDKLVTLAIDGWSNVTNEPVLGIMMDTQLLASIDTTGLHQTVPLWETFFLFCQRASPHWGIPCHGHGDRRGEGQSIVRCRGGGYCDRQRQQYGKYEEQNPRPLGI